MRVWVVFTLIAASISQLLLLSSGQELCGWPAGISQSNRLSPLHPLVTPTPLTPGGDITSIISQELYDEMLPHRSTPNCVGAFYTYESFVTAARAFPAFGNTGDLETRQREVAAFFGQTSQQTTGRPPDGPYTWGYCWIKPNNDGTCCVPDENFPCVPGKTYCGRGPIQLSYNSNYGQAGEALGLDLLNSPELLETDPVVSFKTAIWFWMTPQPSKPSCHEAIIARMGYGLITNIITGGEDCKDGPSQWARICYYARYCDLYGIGYGDNLACYQQQPFGSGFVFASK